MISHQIMAENIKCDGCVAKIKEAIMPLQGVTAVEVSKEEGKVCISGIAIEKKDMVKKLAELGYPEKGHNGFISKAKSYLTCQMEKFS